MPQVLWVFSYTFISTRTMNVDSKKNWEEDNDHTSRHLIFLYFYILYLLCVKSEGSNNRNRMNLKKSIHHIFFRFFLSTQTRTKIHKNICISHLVYHKTAFPQMQCSGCFFSFWNAAGCDLMKACGFDLSDWVCKT